MSHDAGVPATASRVRAALAYSDKPRTDIVYRDY